MDSLLKQSNEANESIKEWGLLLQHITEDLWNDDGDDNLICEKCGRFIQIRSIKDDVILYSAHMSSIDRYEELLEHVGHPIVCTSYQSDDIISDISIECMMCSYAIYTVSNPNVDDGVCMDDKGCVISKTYF